MSPFDSVAQLSTKSAEPLSGALFSPVRLFEPIEVRSLLGEHKPGAFVACFELDGRGRHRRRTSVSGQHGRVDDPFVGDDVAVEGVEDNLRAAVVGVIDLSPAHAEIKLMSRIAASEPPPFGSGIGPSSEDPSGWHRIRALMGEGGMGNGVISPNLSPR